MNGLLILLQKEKLLQVARVLCRERDRFDWIERNPDTVPSLVVLLSALPDINAVILEPGHWSPQHIASAAKILRSRGGKLIMLGIRPFGMEKDIPLILRTEDLCDLPDLLAERSAAGAVVVPAAPAEDPQPTETEYQPMEDLPAADSGETAAMKLVIPKNGETIFITVAGSDQTANCLAHSLAILQYLQKQGLSPALLLTKQQLEEQKKRGVAFHALGHCRWLGGIPVDTDTQAGLYNAYVRCIGILSPENKTLIWKSDWSVLACGISPESRRLIARALLLMNGRKYASAIFSGMEASVSPEVAQIVPFQWTAASPMDDPWVPMEDGDLVPYDRILRPFLQEKFGQNDYAWEHQKAVGT